MRRSAGYEKRSREERRTNAVVAQRAASATTATLAGCGRTHGPGTPAAEHRTFLTVVSGAGFFLLLALFLAALVRPAAAETQALIVVDDSALDRPVAAGPPAAAGSLDDLLRIPVASEADTTDESLAAAIARGHEPSRTKQSGFRKRNIDLFRAERPVEIGEQEMLLRLRLRAKKSEAVSVELRF